MQNVIKDKSGNYTTVKLNYVLKKYIKESQRKEFCEELLEFFDKEHMYDLRITH
jgi:hypothetical protein